MEESEVQHTYRNMMPEYQTRAKKTNPTSGGIPKGLVDDLDKRVDAKIKLMRERYESGLDLWTGEPLSELEK